MRIIVAGQVVKRFVVGDNGALKKPIISLLILSAFCGGHE